MCGISGFVFLQGIKRDESMMTKVRFIFDQLAYETQQRGEHATGIASFRRDGSYEFYKKDINADKMTTQDKSYRKIVNSFDANETSVVLLHTRYFTKGKPENNLNNHPFDIGNIVGIHNGSVKNDDQLFKRYGFNRIGEVDSEIIFQLINYYNKEGIALTGLRKALEDTRIRGLFALAFVHKNNPNMLHLIKQEKPMYIAYWQEAGIVIFNSIDSYILNAFHTLERVGHAFGINDAKQDVEIKKVADDSYFTVNANAKTLEEAISKPVAIYLESSNVIYTKQYNGSFSTASYTKCGGKSKKVKATDSKGLTVQGEIDRETGEILIVPTDDYVGSLDDEIYSCFECYKPLTEEELNASYNASNPKEESICMDCYSQILEYYMENELEEKEKVDCDRKRVV